MSVDAHRWAREWLPLLSTRRARAVLRELADEHRGDSGRCSIALSQLEELTGYSRNPLRAARDELRSLGLIAWSEQAGRYDAAEYRLVLTQRVSSSPPEPAPVIPQRVSSAPSEPAPINLHRVSNSPPAGPEGVNPGRLGGEQLTPPQEPGINTPRDSALTLDLEELAPPSATPAKTTRWTTEGRDVARRYLDAHKARHGRPSPHKFNAAAEVLSRFAGVDTDRLLAAALNASTLSIRAVEVELNRGHVNGAATAHRDYARGGARS